MAIAGPVVNARVAAQGRAPSALARRLPALGWWLLSVGLFAGAWELCWALGWANPMLLPPPHIFLQDLFYQGRFFDRSTRVGNPSGMQVALVVLQVVLTTTLRVIAGLALAFVLSLVAGALIRYWRVFGKLTLPTLNVLAPVSPIAWLPIAMLLFGIGNGPAVFMVVIALFFIMTLATVSLIDQVPRRYLQVASIMGASRAQIYLHVLLPAVLPGLFLVLRLNLFAAWMAVLIAESVGVGSGMGLVVMMAKNTFNAQLAFFTMAVIGLSGYALDACLKTLQRRVLYWLPSNGKGWSTT